MVRVWRVGRTCVGKCTLGSLGTPAALGPRRGGLEESVGLGAASGVGLGRGDGAGLEWLVEVGVPGLAGFASGAAGAGFVSGAAGAGFASVAAAGGQ